MALSLSHTKDDNSAKIRKRRRTERKHKKRTSAEHIENEEDPGGKSVNISVLQDMPRQNRASRRAQVKPFIEHTLKTGVAGLITEFKMMKRSNDFNLMTEFVAQIPQGRNRYKDVGCLDYQRVVLNIGPVSYIHANYVATPLSPKRFICTQVIKVLILHI
ncbi:Tyrosine-protein phosphatase domain-containing protein [Trichostrongylus colubriformis]|uniref:Tyrosine-protein phosphatase domain-containing protein n=1 Tax=Trichostrongylus colubriformis TaxID=6319 RepID=A0AAN8EX11_TRICO